MKNIILVILTSILITSCCTIVSGKRQKITINSNPDSAIVKLNGKPIGVTPLCGRFNRENAKYILLEKNGYVSDSTAFVKDDNWWLLGNLPLFGLFSSPIGFLIDEHTGAWCRIVNKKIYIELKKE